MRRFPGSVFRLFLLVLPVLGCQSAPQSPDFAIDEEVECSREALARVGPLDVAMVIDTSMSTLKPTGSDIDGDGVLGVLREGVVTDRDDTRLGAQVAGLRALLSAVDGADVRFALITYSGAIRAPIHPYSRVVKADHARLRAPLGSPPEVIEAELEAAFARGGAGTSDFYAGMHRASRALIEAKPTTESRRRLVLFISDSGGPVIRQPDGTVQWSDPHLEFAMHHAREHGITFNTFGLSAKSGRWRFDPLGRIAIATGGTYHMVEDPHALYCHLANALLFPDALF